MWIIENRKDFYRSIPYYIRRYKNILLYFISVFIAIEILPAGKWTVYFTYYFFPICFLMSKTYLLIISSKGRYIVLFFLLLALIRFFVVHIYLSDFLDLSTLLKLFLFYVPIITIMLFFNEVKLNLLYVLIFLGLGLKIFYLYHDWVVYNEVTQIYESNPDQPIISKAPFNWIDRSKTNYGFAPFRNIDPAGLNSGLVIFGETEASRGYPVKTFLEYCSDCDFQLIGTISSSYDSFVWGKFAGLKVYRYSGFNVINSPFY